MYTLNINSLSGGLPPRTGQQNVRSKEEKEDLEHFSGVVSNSDLSTYKLASLLVNIFIEHQATYSSKTYNPNH